MTTALSSSNRKISILIIIAALCIHGGIGSLLFIIEPTYLSLDAEKARVILFNERMLNEQELNERSLNKQELNKQKLTKPLTSTALIHTPHEEWGEMLGRKNNFGLPNGGIAIDETTKKITHDSSAAQDQQKRPENLPLEPSTPNTKKELAHTTDKPVHQQEPPLSKNLLNDLPSPTSPKIAAKEQNLLSTGSTELVQDIPSAKPEAHVKTEIEATQATEFSEKQTPLTPHDTRVATKLTQAEKSNSLSRSTHLTQTPSGLTLASIGKGFIEQSKHDGTHNVTMLGKKGGALSAEQLKMERYVERLAWCLQNSFKLLRNTIDLQLPPECNAQVHLQLDRSGAIQTLELTKSSGNTALDKHTLAVFKNAGSSFPPVPTYITASPFAISFHIDYGIDEQSMPLSFSLRH